MFWDRWFMSKKPRIDLTVDPAEHRLYTAWANQLGFNLRDWVRHTLKRSIPDDVRHRYANSEDLANVQEMAFDLLDQMDGSVRNNTVPAPPIKVGNRHPCRFLSPEIPDNYTWKDCHGICTHVDKRGRPCNWNANVARQCPIFQIKTHR